MVVPARNEAGRVGLTVASASTVAQVRAVVVVDDGSSDATAGEAVAAGAVVVQHSRTRGKGAAMTTGARRAAGIDDRAALLFLDADLQDTAWASAALVDAVLGDTADMAIGTLPPGAPGGGHGFVVRLSRREIERRTGWVPTQPLSGQRCITRALFDELLPLARGFGVETRMTIDAHRLGARVVEVPVEMRHRVTGTSMRDQLHRARQYRDVWLATRLSRR